MNDYDVKMFEDIEEGEQVAAGKSTKRKLYGSNKGMNKKFSQSSASNK